MGDKTGKLSSIFHLKPQKSASSYSLKKKDRFSKSQASLNSFSLQEVHKAKIKEKQTI